MKIAVLGTGNMGSGLGKRWAEKGHSVRFGSRDPAKAKELASSVGHNASAASVAEAAKFGDAVLLAVPWSGVADTLAAAGSLKGKLLIDCTNPLTPDFMDLVVGHTTSGAEEVAKLTPSAKVVKAFNTIFAQIVHSSAAFGPERATVFYCGDDAAAKSTVARLIDEIGFEPVDAGPLKNARYVEPLAELMIQMAYALGTGPMQAVKLMRR